MASYKECSKEFLNQHPHQHGSVSWYVEVDEGSRELEANLRITDCYKIINLEFFTGSSKGLDKRIEKLDTMIESLHRFRDALCSGDNARHLNQLIRDFKDERESSKTAEKLCES